MSDSGDESEGWEIEKQAIRLKKYRRELFHSRRGNGSLKVQNKIKLRLADSAKRLIGYYRKKFDEMRTNASTNEEDLEEVGMKLFELYYELFQLGTVQGINDWKTGTYDINSCLFDFYERSCSNLPLSVELFSDHDKLCKKLQVVASSIMDLDLPLMRSDWGTRIVRLKQPWIQFYEGQLNGLPVSFETLKDAESIAEKLKNLYSEMTKLEPDGVNNWPAKNVRLEEHLIEFLSKLLAKLPVSFESYSDAEVICGKLKSFFLEGIELYPRFAWTYEAKIFELEKELARRKRFKWHPNVASMGMGMFYGQADGIEFLLVELESMEGKRRGARGVGGNFRIPIVSEDNGTEKEKMDFVHNFSHLCSQLTPLNPQLVRDHVDWFSKTRTLYLHLEKGSLIDPIINDPKWSLNKITVWKKALFDLLVNKVREEIDPDLVGYMVNDASKYRSACTTGLLESLVERTGNDPVLLVLDGIGAAFDHECNFRFRRERFLDFCESILNSWLMSCDNFYFLLIGGGDIFEFLQDGRSVQRGRYDIIPFAGGPTMNKNTPRLY